MSSGNYAALRERVLSSGQEQKVLVNQRHLIDKILARYSAEYTVYRELLQNSDDAGMVSAWRLIVWADRQRSSRSSCSSFSLAA